ncbi:MAG TPA: hypothetical protein DEP84_02095 [Chloroflexi bacterium]|nr:hypothetical protein [Chloroflexota bacterium]
MAFHQPATTGSKTGNTVSLDELDVQILMCLQADSRQSNLEIARQVDASESTVRRRIDRLIDAGVIEMAAILDPTKVGYQLEVLLLLIVDKDKVDSIANQLAAFPQVNYVCVMTGEFDILAQAWFRSNARFLDFIRDGIGAIEGIRESRSSIVLHAAKRTNYWVPLG